MLIWNDIQCKTQTSLMKTQQTYDCPESPLSSGYIWGCQVNWQYLIPLSSSLGNVIYTQNDIVRAFSAETTPHFS